MRNEFTRTATRGGGRCIGIMKRGKLAWKITRTLNYASRLRLGIMGNGFEASILVISARDGVDGVNRASMGDGSVRLLFNQSSGAGFPDRGKQLSPGFLDISKRTQLFDGGIFVNMTSGKLER